MGSSACARTPSATSSRHRSGPKGCMAQTPEHKSNGSNVAQARKTKPRSGGGLYERWFRQDALGWFAGRRALRIATLGPVGRRKRQRCVSRRRLRETRSRGGRGRRRHLQDSGKAVCGHKEKDSFFLRKPHLGKTNVEGLEKSARCLSLKLHTGGSSTSLTCPNRQR